MRAATLASTATATLVAPRVGGKAGISHLGTFDAAQAPRRRDVVLAPHAAGAAPGSRGSAGAPRSFSRRVSSRLVVARLNALSEPPAGSEVETKAERFLREELEHQGVDVDALEAPETAEEVVATLEDEVSRLSERKAALSADLDAAYRDAFADLEAETDAGERISLPSIDEASFRALATENPEASAALIRAAQEGDQARWLAFQRQAHRSKLQRDRVSTELAAAIAELATARRGGGTAKAAEAARQAAREAAERAAATRSADGVELLGGGSASDVATRRIVLISGFESFNVKLYRRAAKDLARRCPGIELIVFSDRDIEADREAVESALDGADVFFGSLLFDFDQVQWLRTKVEQIPTRFVFESALELMSTTSVGSFEMKPAPDGQKAGPPPAVKAILSKFGSGKEEDKLVGYLSFLKIGPALLRFVPGRKAKDLRNWLTVYGYWNQGGRENVEEAFAYVAREYLGEYIRETPGRGAESLGDALGALVGASKHPRETPALGFYHPEIEARGGKWPTSAEAYLDWFERERDSPPLPADAPTVAVLLYRKHVITQQPYLADLVRAMEESGLRPVPIFINGVEAHTIVRDLLTTDHEREQRAMGHEEIDSLSPNAVCVDAVVSTVGFPLVGGPAGSMEAGRQAEVAKKILQAKNVPYVVAAPLLIQDIASWSKSGIGGLQSVILYALPELDGAVDAVPLGGLVKDDIYLVRERVYALCERLNKWVALRKKSASERNIAVMLYGFPPGVGATGTAALLNVPKSLERTLKALRDEGYDLGDAPIPSGEALVDALRALEDGAVIAGGQGKAAEALEKVRQEWAAKVNEETMDDLTEKGVAATAFVDPLAGVTIEGEDVSPHVLKKWLEFPAEWGPTEWGPMPYLPSPDLLVRNMEKAWGALESYNGLATVPGKGSFVAGLRIGKVFIGVQPALGVEGDPMRLLFERDLTPHPQYAAYYKWLQRGFNADAVLHMGMHGTVEWLPGSPLGNTGMSWSDQLLGSMPNVYVYAANNPSESIVAKRRGYGTIISHNVPPYGRAGLYKQTAELRELLGEYREDPKTNFESLRGPIFDLVAAAGLDADCPFIAEDGDSEETTDKKITAESIESGEISVSAERFEGYAADLTAYLGVLENRLFSEGLHVLGEAPSASATAKYLEAYFGETLPPDAINLIASSAPGSKVEDVRASLGRSNAPPDASPGEEFMPSITASLAADDSTLALAIEIRDLLARNSEELAGAIKALGGEYVLPAVGGDLLRDGPGVLPTGRNIHALDPYRMPSPAAADRGARVARAILAQHCESNDGAYPETVSVNLWGLDAIKTKGESVGIVLELVGARSIKEGTGRVVRYELIPLSEMGGRPRVDVLCNMSGIFRDSFANVVGLLDDLFDRASKADEPPEMNFVRKHALQMRADGVAADASKARLFSNPPGDYGSMVNERVGTSEWEDGRELGDTWAARNAFSYGKGDERGAARPEVLQALLKTTERVVQEVDSVEYGLTDIQEYYANTGALVAAANAAKEEAFLEASKNFDIRNDQSGEKPVPPKPVKCSVVETFGEDVTPRDLDETLRLEYRTKLLNPRWADAMANQGSGGAYEISQRMTALVGWGATSGFQEDWVYDGAHERYVVDEEMREKLRRANPQAFRNVLRRMLEAAGRGMWNADDDVLERLRTLYAETEDELEGVRTRP